MSSDLVNIKFLEVLSSKLCHDLISPIGAVNNGLEVLEELGPDAGPEVIDLISHSADQASAKLKAFRLAYGIGGADGHIRPADVKSTIDQVIERDGKVKQVWDASGDLGFMSETGELHKGFCKVLTCVLLLALETLPKGGEIDLREDGEAKAHILARGENATMRPDCQTALALNVTTDHVEPQAVHSVVTALMAKQYGFHVSFTQNAGDEVQLTLEKV